MIVNFTILLNLNFSTFSGVRSYGKDFQAMAEVLGNKTVSQCRNFFVNYRRRFNLLDILEEYEKEHSIVSDRTGDLWDEIAMSDAEPFANTANFPGPSNPRMPFIPGEFIPGYSIK